jgi:hypothetical protein
MRFVPVRVKRPPQGTRALLARVVLPGDDRFAPWVSPSAMRAGGVLTAFRDKAHKGYDPERDAGQTTAMVVDGALVVRKARAASALEELIHAGVVALRPVALSSAVAGARPALDKPVLEDDWALVDVLARFPIDRATLSASCFDESGTGEAMGAYDPARPYASLVASRPDVLTWSAGREPDVPAFRLHELPIDVFLREDVLARLDAALGGALEEGRSRPTIGMLDETTDSPPFAIDEARAEQAMTAFYRGLRGALERGDRERALASPIYAYLTARLIDRGPGDDTRRGACAHPFYAAAYARDVDRAPRDDTRDAAAAAEASAIEYLRYVDRGPHERTRAAFTDGYRASEYEIEAARVAAATQAVAAQATPAARPEPQAQGGGGKRKRADRAEPTFTPLLMRGPKRGDVYVIAPGAPEQELTPAADPGRAGVVAIAPKPQGARSLRKRIASLVALGGSDLAPFLLRRDVAERVLGHLPAEDLALRAVEVRDDAGPLDADFVWLDVRVEAPLDRDASDAVYTDPKRPHASLVKVVRAFVFDPRRAPRAAMFRVGEFPNIVMIRDDLLETLRAATANAAATVKSPHDHLPMFPAFPLWSVGPKIAQTARESSASAAAYYALARGDHDGALREAALASPIYGYWVARSVDGHPEADTRAAALLHPHYAALYARWVDRAPRDDTRKAAATDAASALYYAKYVDVKLTPAIKKVLLGSGWGADDVRTITADLERVRELR